MQSFVTKVYIYLYSCLLPNSSCLQSVDILIVLVSCSPFKPNEHTQARLHRTRKMAQNLSQISIACEVTIREFTPNYAGGVMDNSAVWVLLGLCQLMRVMGVPV